MNFQMFKLDLQKAEEPEIKLPHPLYHPEDKMEQKAACVLNPCIVFCGKQKDS